MDPPEEGNGVYQDGYVRIPKLREAPGGGGIGVALLQQVRLSLLASPAENSSEGSGWGPQRA